MNNTSAITPIQPSLVPQTAQNNVAQLEYYWKIANKAYTSSLSKVNKIEDAFFLIGYGHELGISPFAALRTIYVVNGVPTCSGEMMLALIRRSGLLATSNIEELTNPIGAKVTMKRKDTGEEISITFTMNDAETAGLANKQVWKNYPKNMCRWRAVSNVAKLLFGDVIGGLYTFEEIADDNQQIDETGAPVGDIIESTASKPASQNKTVSFSPQDTGAGQSEPPPPEEEKPEEQPSQSWLQIPENKQWLFETLKTNNLSSDFFKQIDPTATSWTDIARKYKDRSALEQAISDAMLKDTADEPIEEGEIINDTPEQQYENPFPVPDTFPSDWSDGAYSLLTTTINQYFDEDAEDLIRGGLGIEDPELEYSSPLELWNDVVALAQREGTPIICNLFRYVDYGKSGRIETHHPILALSFSRTKFIEMIGDKQFTSATNIADWTTQDKPHNLQRELVITYETKLNNKTGKQYSLITGASIKPLDMPDDPDNLNDFFGE